MEQPIKIILSVIIFLSISIDGFALDVIPLPNDQPTIEALIDAHKKMRKAEDLAVLEITAIEETHRLTDKAAKAFNQTRTVLNKRMSDVNSYIMLATRLTKVTLSMKKLVGDYKDFTTLTYQNALKHPMAMFYFTRANLLLKKEIEHLTHLIAGYVSSQVNILKATMKEKYQMLSEIEMSIANLHRIIMHNDLVCRSMLYTGIKIWHIQDIFNKETQELILHKIIALWIKNSK